VENYNVFAGAFVDRIGERRKDSAWLAEALRSEQCSFVPVWGDRCLVGGFQVSAAAETPEQVGGVRDGMNPSGAAFDTARVPFLAQIAERRIEQPAKRRRIEISCLVVERDGNRKPLHRAALTGPEVHDRGHPLCVLANPHHSARVRRGQPLRRQPNSPVQVWAFARRPPSPLS